MAQHQHNPSASLARQADKDNLNTAKYLDSRKRIRTFRCSLRTVRLHCDVRVQVVQSTVGLFASVPAALVHALNLLIAAARSLVLLRTWNGYK
jgi:hypothetical protein